MFTLLEVNTRVRPAEDFGKYFCKTLSAFSWVLHELLNSSKLSLSCVSYVVRTDDFQLIKFSLYIRRRLRNFIPRYTIEN